LPLYFGAMQKRTDVIRRRLRNGLTIVCEPMPNIRSISIGVWLRRGSRHETNANAGMSHFIEHMLFKGTRNRTAREISREVDAVGGNLDAFTSKEYACYYARALSTEMPLLVDLLSDLVQNPLFPRDEMTRERQVVLEEIKMIQDAPEEEVHDIFLRHLYRDHPLGRSICGTATSVRRLDREKIRRFFRKTYVPSNLLVSIAGHFETRELLRRLRGAFSHLPSRPGGARETEPHTRSFPRILHRERLQQAHLCLGLPAINQTDNDRDAAGVLNTILGGSMSSRLFQQVREERGLVYSIGSGLYPHRDTGYFLVSAACSPGNIREVLEVTLAILRDLAGKQVPEEELGRAKGHLKGNMMLGLESSVGRMSSLALQEIVFGRQISLDAAMRRIDAISGKDIQRVAKRLFDGKRLSLAIVGNLKATILRGLNLAL